MNRIVLCGSVKFKERFFEVEEQLKARGYEVILPKELTEELTKEEASRLHFSQVESKDTDAILVINCNKNGKNNYIGANTFAEIAFAFYFNKKIYLLNDMFKGCIEELEAWKAEPLQGDLEKINL